MSAAYAEQAVLLGDQQSLVGIITRPAAPPAAEQPVVVILNTGVVHRIGHHRMYVALARQLASAGRTVLRFDFSGIGDSRQRNDRLSPLDSCLADIKEALDTLQKRHHTSRFVLLGLCSGADHAVLYGHTDPRVVGLILLDPTVPPTARYYMHYVAQRLVNLRNWVSVITLRSGLLRMLMARIAHGVAGRQHAGGVTLEGLRFSPYLAQCYKSSVDHGIRLMAAFTSTSPRQTYRRQMLDAFSDVSFADHLRLEYFPESDHLFTAEKDRARLGEVVMDWLACESACRQPVASRPETDVG